MERVAYQKNLPLIDVRDEFLAIHNYRDYLCLDGIHLNGQGQKVMADIFQSYAMNYAIKIKPYYWEKLGNKFFCFLSRSRNVL